MGLHKGQKHAGQFQKGQVTNPRGAKKLPADIRAARSMSYEEMCRTVIDVRRMTLAEVKQIDIAQETLGKRAILNAFIKLDYKGIRDYEDRLWGKAKETHAIEDFNKIGIKVIFENITKKE